MSLHPPLGGSLWCAAAGCEHGGRKKPFLFRQPDPVHKRLEEYSGNITVLGRALKRSAGYYAVAALAATKLCPYSQRFLVVLLCSRTRRLSKQAWAR